jgi:tripartite-type tricarboxylate transporter receptor subunit TctC
MIQINTRSLKKLLMCFGLTGLSLFITSANAQTGTYPAPGKSIKFLVPITPGGSNDVMARVIAQKLTDLWSVPVVVENRPGGNMNVGSDVVAKSAPDGYTWLLGANNIFVFNPHLGKMPFDVFKDLVPVTQVAAVPFVLVVHPSLPVKSVAELVEYAKKNPGTLNYGSSGNGAPQHLAAELLSNAAGIKMAQVPYKGAVPAITDLLAGRIQLFVGAINSLLPHIKDGKLRLLATAGPKRLNAFPDVPTIAETVPGVVMDVWLGVFMPAGTPRPIINKAQTDIAKVLQQPDVIQNLALQGIEGVSTTSETLAGMIRDDYARWGKIIKDANIVAD